MSSFDPAQQAEIAAMIKRATGRGDILTRQNQTAIAATGSFSVWLSGATSLTTLTVVPFDTEEWDTSGWHDASTNKGRYTPKIAGTYRFSGLVRPNTAVALAADQAIIGFLAKNGTAIKTGTIGYQRGTTQFAGSLISATAQANGTTDFFEMIILHEAAGSLAIRNTQSGTYFQGELIGF